MKIEIVLKDPAVCDDCPCLDGYNEICNIFSDTLDVVEVGNFSFRRLKECREKYGD
jgi:hypothetical protein